MKISIKTCPKCKEKHLTMEGTDNAYWCRKCKREITSVKEKWFDVPDHQLGKHIEKYYTGEFKE